MRDIFNVVDIPEKYIIQRESAIAEKLGKLTSTELAIIYKNKWFHLLIPKSLGGAEMTLPEFSKLMEGLAAVDGSFAWNINLGAGANMFAGFMDQKAASEIFKSKTACVAGSGTIGGTAKREDDGFIIDGYWKYASGSAHATYFSLNAQLTDSNDEGAFASFLVPAAEVQILDTWNVFGMKATSSCDFKVNNIWVPESFLFNLQKPSATVDSTLYRFPFMLLAEINMLVMVSGLAIHFYELLNELAKDKNFTIEEVLNEVMPLFLESRKLTFTLLDKLWQEIISKEQIPVELSRSFNKSVTRTVQLARQLVDVLYPFAGMKVVFEDTEISRVYRDFKVASQHGLLSPATRI